MNTQKQSRRRTPPDITEDNVRNLVEVARRTNEQDWLILRLITECDFKTGEVVGTKTETANIPAIINDDLGDDFIWVRRRPEFPRDVNPGLIGQIRDLAKRSGRENGKDAVFVTKQARIEKVVKKYARAAKIRDWRKVRPGSLRNTLAPKASPFLKHLRKSFDFEISSAERMADFYIANFCLENSIRRLIRETLSKDNQDWWEQKVPPDIKEYVRERQNEERDTPMSKRSNEPLDYTTFGHLSTIIVANWSSFKDKIRSRDAMIEILAELNDLRAVIAHSCAMNERERTRLDLRVRDWQGVLIQRTGL